MAQRQRSPWLQNAYSKHYYPSAPVLNVAIAGPKAMDWIEAGTALIDSGADATIVPSHLVNAVAAAELDHAWLRGQWGDSRLVYQYEIDIRIGNRIFPNGRAEMDCQPLNVGPTLSSVAAMPCSIQPRL